MTNAYRKQKIQTYHPYLTYFDPLNFCFIRVDGKHRDELDEDTEALFSIGQQAYRLLPQVDLKDVFDEGFSGYLSGIDKFRTMLSDMQDVGQLKPVTPQGLSCDPDWEALSNGQILAAIWSMVQEYPAHFKASPDTYTLLRELFLFYVLDEIDNALISLGLGHSGAVVASIEAANALANVIVIDSGTESLQKLRSEMALQGAMAKLKRDPKQQEKAFVRDCWQTWQENPGSYKGQAAFAVDMLNKCEHLESTKVIEGWCTQWKKESSKPAS